jgi:hypothetical protein
MPAIDDAAFHIVSSPPNMLSMILIPLPPFCQPPMLTLRHYAAIFTLFFAIFITP